MWMVIGALPAAAAATCGGEAFDSLAEALADPACTEVRLDAGLLIEAVVVDRALTLTGAGRGESFLACARGPCLQVAPGAALTLAGLTVGSDTVTIAARLATIRLTDAALVSVHGAGGTLRLKDSDATLSRVALEAHAKTMAIDAVSGRGHDLSLQHVTFQAAPWLKGTMARVYSLNYGVVCENCTIDPARTLTDRLAELLARQAPEALATETARWPQIGCPQARPEDEVTCTSQCPGRRVAHCRMRYDDASERCLPLAVCVPEGEVPADPG